MPPQSLISFLGRAPRAENRTYRKTQYRFPDGRDSETTAFLGYAIARRHKVDRLIVLGTPGSMWDHLFESDVPLGDDFGAQRLALMDAVDRKLVTQDMLDELAPVLAHALNHDVRLAIIPYGYSQAEQTEILGLMADSIQDGDRIHLDVTHGFRYLPMIALLAAMFLRVSRRATIEGLWYGGFDPDHGRGEVVNLSGMLAIADALHALSAFDEHGDYRVFAPIIQDAGLTARQRESFSQAGYFENILNVSAATGCLHWLMPGLKNAETTASTPIARLLAPQIAKRLEWHENDQQFKKQLSLAKHALERKDYLRATLYAYESVITRICHEKRVQDTDFKEREAARDAYEKSLQTPQRFATGERYRLLKNLRNQVAHGTRDAQGEIQRTLLQEQKLNSTLAALIEEIEAGLLP